MNTREQARRLVCKVPLLLAAVYSTGVSARDDIAQLGSNTVNLPKYIKTLKNASFESIKYSKSFRMKGWKVSNDIYVGGAKIAGEYGPGVIIDKGSYVWGFNHQGVEFQYRF